MRPNSRETTACNVCGAAIFYALTAAGKWQPLDAAPHASGTVMAYRGVRQWLARTLPAPRPAGAGAQLELGAVAEVVDDPREHPAHPLEQRYRVHAGEACAGARRGVQGDLFADAAPDVRRPVATVPAPRRPTPGLQRKGRRTAQPAADTGHRAQVFDWAEAAPRIAARRRAERPSA